MEQPAAAVAMVPSVGDGGALAGTVAAFDDGHRHVGAHAGAAQTGRQLVQGADAHQDHNRPAEPGQVGEFLLRQRCMAGNHREHVADFAVRDRDSGGSRDGDGARDAGDHPDGHTGFHARGNFLAAAAEDVRVAALEPDHVLSGLGGPDHQFLDAGLADLMVAGLLADVDEVCRGQCGQLLVGGEPVVEHDVGVPQRRHSRDREQLGGARAAAHQGDMAGRSGRRFGGDGDADGAAPLQQRLPAGLAVVDGGDEEGPFRQLAVVAGAVRGCSAGRPRRRRPRSGGPPGGRRNRSR